MKTRQAYRLIADILALGSYPGEKTANHLHASDSPVGKKPEDRYEGSTAGKDALHYKGDIIKIIDSGEVDWKGVVYTGSNNYVLQAIFLKLEKNGLLKHLPEELTNHLRKLYEMNLDRNSIILEHTAKINSLLKTNDITPIFMKGLGNMLDGLYSSPGERMMIDIDILTDPEQMEQAADLLMADGFTPAEQYDPSRKPAMKHFPPLVKEGLPAFVDIHRMPVNIQYDRHFSYETAITGKRPAKGNPKYMVMSDAHKIHLNFIHSQLVHWGHQHAIPSLRDLYDLYLLSGREDTAAILTGMDHYRSHATGYLKILYETFGIAKPLPTGTGKRGTWLLKRHRIAINNRKTGKFIYTILRALRLYIDIPLRSIFDKNYRLYVKFRLKDPEWYKRNLGVRKIVKKKEPAS